MVDQIKRQIGGNLIVNKWENCFKWKTKGGIGDERVEKYLHKKLRITLWNERASCYMSQDSGVKEEVKDAKKYLNGMWWEANEKMETNKGNELNDTTSSTKIRC